MYAMSGLIGTLMASFSQNVGSARPDYTMQAFGWPFLITIAATVLIFVLTWVLNRNVTLKSS